MFRIPSLFIYSIIVSFIGTVVLTSMFFFSLFGGAVGEAGDVARRAAQGSVFDHVSRGGHNVRGVVPVRADRAHRRGNADRCAGVALLDQADRGGHRLHRRTRLHVRPVQDVRAALQAVEGLQQNHLRAECPRKRTAATAGGKCGDGQRDRRMYTDTDAYVDIPDSVMGILMV